MYCTLWEIKNRRQVDARNYERCIELAEGIGCQMQFCHPTKVKLYRGHHLFLLILHSEIIGTRLFAKPSAPRKYPEEFLQALRERDYAFLLWR